MIIVILKDTVGICVPNFSGKIVCLTENEPVVVLDYTCPCTSTSINKSPIINTKW